MSAATKTKLKEKPQSKPKDNSRRTKANQANAAKSTGPRTAEGKRNSKYNALKHGRTAESTLLPGDDASAFQARRLEIIEGMQPRNPIEGILLEQIARCEWKSRRGDLSASARLSSQLREESQKTTYDDRDEVIALGQHLLTHPPFPLPISSPNDKGYLGKAPLADVPGDPHHPARLVLKLEQTVCGCDWLLGRWAGLRLRLDIDELWLMADGYEMVRLMGKYVIDMASDYALEMLMLANICVAADGQPENEGKAGDETGPMTIGERWVKLGESEVPFQSLAERLMTYCEPWARALANRPLERLAPKNVAEARRWLTVAMDAEVNRLTLIRAERQRFAEADRAEAPARLAFETGTEGDRLRRYDLSRDRVLLRTVSEFVDVRKASIAGTFNLSDYDLDELTDFEDHQACSHAAPLADSEMSRFGQADVGTLEPVDEPCEPNAAVNGTDDVDALAEIERERASELLWEQVASLAPIREEELRKLNEECQRDEQEASAAARRSRPRAPRNGKPSDRKTPASSRDQEASCDDRLFLRNEANDDCGDFAKRCRDHGRFYQRGGDARRTIDERQSGRESPHQRGNGRWTKENDER